MATDVVFGAFVPQGWKMELSGIDGAAAKWAKAVEVAQLAERHRRQIEIRFLRRVWRARKQRQILLTPDAVEPARRPQRIALAGLDHRELTQIHTCVLPGLRIRHVWRRHQDNPLALGR